MCHLIIIQKCQIRYLKRKEKTRCSPRLIWFLSLQFHPTASAESRQAQGLSIQDEEPRVCCGMFGG